MKEALIRLIEEKGEKMKQPSEMEEELPPESEDTFNPDIPLKTIMNYSRYFAKF